MNSSEEHQENIANNPGQSTDLFSIHNQNNLVTELINMPWVLGNEIKRLLAWPWIYTGFLFHGIKPQKGWRIFGMPIIQKYKGSTIEIGANVEMRSWRSTNPLVPYHPVVLSTRTAAARIEIGFSVGLASARIIAATLVHIGDRTMLGSNCTIVDTDFHPLHPEERQKDIRGGKTAPILIEEDVFIGMNSMILKGVTIGRGSVVGAASVVVKDVPPGSIVAGNPARIIGQV